MNWPYVPELVCVYVFALTTSPELLGVVTSNELAVCVCDGHIVAMMLSSARTEFAAIVIVAV